MRHGRGDFSTGTYTRPMSGMLIALWRNSRLGIDIPVDSDMSGLLAGHEATNRAMSIFFQDQKGNSMNGHSRTLYWVFVVAIIGVALFGLSPAFAQSADRQSDGAAPTLLRSFALFGGSYQEVDGGTEACAGQCLFRNVFTNNCTCPSGYIPVESARIITDTGEGPNVATCGSSLWLCLK